MSAELDIVLKLKDDATKGLQSVGDNLRGIGTAANQANQGGLSSLVDGLGKLGLAGMGVQVVAGAIGAAVAPINAASEAAAQVSRTLNNLPADQIGAVAEEALYLQSAFGTEMQQSLDAADKAMISFGISGEEAMDLITTGMQAGLNQNGDLVDTIREYSQDFARLGLTGDEALQMINAGLEAGIMNTDKIGDAVNEFGINIRDPAVLTAIQDIDTGIAGFVEQFNAGEISEREAFQGIVQGLRNIDDPLQRKEAEVLFFRSVIEDMGEAGVLALGDFADATLDAGDEYRTFGEMGARIGSKLTAALIPVSDALLQLGNRAMPYVMAALDQLGPMVEGLVKSASVWGANLIESFADGVMIAGTAIINALSYIADIITYWLSPGSPPKLLPDLDTWGTGAADAYMEGWTKADFSALNDLARQVEQELRTLVDLGQFDETGVIPAVLGSRQAISAAISQIQETGRVTQAALDDIANAAGPAGDEIVTLIREYANVERAGQEVAQMQEELERATENTTRAQEALNRVTREYDQQLKPLRDALDDTRDQLQLLEDQKRAQELQSIISNEETSEIDRQIAQLELLEIQQRQAVDAKQDEKDIAVDAAKEAVDAAKAEEEAVRKNLERAKEAEAAAQAQYQAQVQMIEANRQNNSLIAEQSQLLARLAEQASAAAGGGGGGAGGGGGGGIGGLAGAAGGLSNAFEPLKTRCEEVRQKFVDLEELFNQVVTTISELQTWWDTMDGKMTTISTTVGTLSGDFQSGFGLVSDVVAQWWEENAPIFEKAQQSLAQFVTDHIPDFVLGWEVMRAGVTNAVSLMTEDVEGDWGATKRGLDLVLQAIGQSFENDWNGIGAHLSTHLSNASQNINTTWTNIQTTLDGLLNGIQTAMSTTWTNIQTTLDGLLNGIQTAMSTVWSAIQKTLGVDLDAIQRAVNDAFQQVECDISGKLDDAKNAVRDAFCSMEQTISGLAGAFLDAARGIGNAIVDGISAGFTAKIQGFIDDLVCKMRSALQSAKNAIGISSPSRAFADEVGAPIAQGISDGFTRGIGAFQDQLTGAIQPRVALTGVPSNSLPASGHGGGMGGHMTITVNVVGAVMSRDMADTIAKQVSRSMGNEYRRRVRT